jgi:hypothetical protein
MKLLLSLLLLSVLNIATFAQSQSFSQSPIDFTEVLNMPLESLLKEDLTTIKAMQPELAEAFKSLPTSNLRENILLLSILKEIYLRKCMRPIYSEFEKTTCVLKVYDALSIFEQTMIDELHTKNVQSVIENQMQK